MKSHFDKLKKEYSNYEITSNDSIVTRIFKNRNKYKIEGLIQCGKVYEKVFNELTKELEDIKKEFSISILEKQKIIDKLLEIVKIYENSEEYTDNQHIERLKNLTSNYIDIFNKDKSSIKEIEMLMNNLSDRYIDWRKTYGYIEEIGNKI